MSAPTPLQWLVLEAVQDMFQTILIANGYRTNIGANVLLETKQTPDSQLPDLVLTGKPGGVTTAGNTFRGTSLQIYCEAKVPASRDNAQRIAWDTHADLLQVIPTRLGRDDLPGVLKLEIEDDDVLQRPEGQPFIVVQVVLRAGLVTNS